MYTVSGRAANPRAREQRQVGRTGGRSADSETGNAARRACARNGFQAMMIPTGRMSGVTEVVSPALWEVVLGVSDIE